MNNQVCRFVNGKVDRRPVNISVAKVRVRMMCLYYFP